MQSKITELLHQYFELGVAEGREGRSHDTEAGDAQRVLSEIEAEIAALSAAEPVKPYGYVVELVGLHEGKEIYVYRSRCQPRLAVAEACAAHWAAIYDKSRWRFKIVPLYAAPTASALSAQVQDVAGTEAIAALKEAEPYVEICHSLITQKETRENVWRVLKRVRAAIAGAPAKQDGGHD